MKIVHFAKFYPPEYGGIESVTQALAEDHAAAGQNVEVICFTRDIPNLEETNGLLVKRVKIWKEIASQPLTNSYLDACVEAARDAAVVHVHAPNILAALATLRLTRHIKVIVHWHADIGNKGMLGCVVRPVERAMLRRADIIVATTQAYADASLALRSFKDRLRIIPIGIADSVGEQKNEIPPRPYVLFVGRLVPYKGLSVLIQAAALVQSSPEFRIVGTGPQFKELKAQAIRLGVTDKVKFLGRVGPDQLHYAADECKRALEAGLPLPAYDQCMIASNVFNTLDARKAVSVTQRQNYILKVRELSSGCAKLYKEQEEERNERLSRV